MQTDNTLDAAAITRSGDAETLALIDGIGDLGWKSEVLDRFLDGTWIVLPGKNPEKPVVRSRAKGSIVKGSGITPGHNDMGQISKDFAHRRTASYREALEKIVSVDGPADQRGSFAWFLQRAMDAADGSPAGVKCPECQHYWIHPFGKKDGSVIVKLIEMLHGKAQEVKEVNLKVQAMQEILEDQSDDYHVYSVSFEEAEERRNIIEGDVRGIS